MINVFYALRENSSPEMVGHEKTIQSPRELNQLLDNYPWEAEIEYTRALGEGGGFYFLLGDEKEAFASFQLIPVEIKRGLLDLNVVAKKGFLGIFGRQSVNVSFDEVSLPEAKEKIRELFDYSVDALYRRYKK